MISLESIKPSSFSLVPRMMDDHNGLGNSPYSRLGGKNSMHTSSDVVEKIRIELRHLEDEIRNHTYMIMLKDKKVDLPALRAFPGHQYHIINSDLRSVAMMLHRFSEPLAQSFFAQVFKGEAEALTNLQPLSHKLGMSEEELQRYPITAEGFAYATYMAWLSMYGSAAEIVAGFLVNFPAWGANCGQMSQSLKDLYGFSSDDTAFLDAFASLPSFESVALQIIQNGLDEGVEAWRIQRAAYLFQRYERMFWDTMAKLEAP